MSSRSSSGRQDGTTEWRSATDAKSGRVYYYNVRTKETTWNKPLELATPEEKRIMIVKRDETLQFFREMEANIKRKIAQAKEREEREAKGFAAGDDSNPKDILYYAADAKDDAPTGRVRFLSGDEGSGAKADLLNGYEGRARMNSFGGPPRRVRTISTMDDEILLLMRASSGEDRRTTMYTQNKVASIVAEEKLYRGSDRADGKGYKDDGVIASQSPAKPPLKRRNSTGTIYIQHTMSAQDNNLTIQCVCTVIRAHMIQAAKENIEPIEKYDVFKDAAYVQVKGKDSKDSNPMALVPSLQTVKDFFTLVFSKSQLESDCIIMALIYCERLVKETRGRLCIRYDNWRSILFACLVMASKVWDDLSMWNVDFSQVYPSFDLTRVNTLELAMLEALKYVIRVPASEYAKYYFHLRSMMVKLGLENADANSLMRPLDIAGARRLQLSTEKYEQHTSSNLTQQRRRHHSMHESHSLDPIALERGYTENFSVGAMRSPVGLEQIVHTEHMDADGLKKKGSMQNVYHK
eukprot:gene32098-38817_t